MGEDSDANVFELENFEQLLMSMSSKDLKGASVSSSLDTDSQTDSVGGGRAFTEDEIFDEKRQSKLQQESKEFDRVNLKKAISRNGFIVFKDYESKLKMMDTALFLFGLKLHRQEGHVKFHDADFLNTLYIQSVLFEDQTLGDCCRLINEVLSNAGY